MKLKIRAFYLTKYPMWRVIDETGREIEFYDRELGMFKGLTKQQLVEILRQKGYEVSGK